MPSRPVLIGRGLVTHTTHKPPPQQTPTNPHQHRVHHPESEPTNPTPTTHPGDRAPVHNRTTVQPVTAAIAARKHPDPSRTRKLSQPAPMVLHPTGCGRVVRRRTSSPEGVTAMVAPSGMSGLLGAVPRVSPSRSRSTAAAQDRLLRRPSAAYGPCRSARGGWPARR